MRILLVEDEPRIAAFLAKALRHVGHDVAHVSTGTDAVNRAAETPFIDVVVLDLGLPDIDGLDVLARLNEAGLEIPVIVLTARTDTTDRDLALERGASQYLVKPVLVSDFLGHVRAAATSP